MQKFFEIIPSGTTIQFVKHAWKFIVLSLVLGALSIGAMVYNTTVCGSVLNFGIDFQGGSTVRVALDRERSFEIQEIRDALLGMGYEGASALTVPDAENEIMIRIKEVHSIDPVQAKACKDALASYETAKLLQFNYPPEGASKIFLKFDSQPIYGELERILDDAGCEGRADKGTGKEGEFPVEVSLIGIGAKLQEQLNAQFGAGTVDHIVSSETVGSKVGGQLKRDGIQSLLFAIGFIFLYVMLRFDLRYAPGGIVALVHDAFIVIGAFAITYKEFNLQTIAALLTVIGYSINDTIVVFDRIREQVALNRDGDIEEITNTALNETLSRTILTSATTMIVVLSVWLLGSGPIKDFAFALIVGLLVGTYSSLFIASPIFLWINRRFYAGEGHLLSAEAVEREGTGTLLGSATGAEIDSLSGRTVGELRAEAKGGAGAESTAAAGTEGTEAAQRPMIEASATTVTVKPSSSIGGDEPQTSRRRRRRRPGT